jgi:hypothetical protein
MSDKEFSIQTFPVKIEGDDVYLLLPSIEALDEMLATEKTCNGACDHVETAKPKKLPVRKAKAGDAQLVAADERV